jgi:hypothetical protein
MLVLMTAALLGDLILLPAILAGPLGRIFAGRNSKGVSCRPKRTQPEPKDAPPVTGQGPHGSLSPEGRARMIRRDAPHDQVRR